MVKMPIEETDGGKTVLHPDASTETVKPSMLDRSNGFVGSSLRKSEAETIAANVVTISKFKFDDEWKPFTWEEYKEACSHKVTESEKGYLDQFVENDLMVLDGGKYVVRNAFIIALRGFIKWERQEERP